MGGQNSRDPRITAMEGERTMEGQPSSNLETRDPASKITGTKRKVDDGYAPDPEVTPEVSKRQLLGLTFFTSALLVSFRSQSLPCC